MPRHIEIANWPRRAAFEFFHHYDNPYFNVCVQLDVTALVHLCRGAERPSFSLASLYLALRAANETEPFRYRLDGSGVLVHDRIHAGTTHLVAGERLVFVYFDYAEEFATFSRGAEAVKQTAEEAGDVLDGQKHRTDLIHFSSLPWVSFTSLSHARNWGTDESIPKITFGRHFQDGGQVKIPVSVEVHHALMDGSHVGRYLERLQAYLTNPAPIEG